MRSKSWVIAAGLFLCSCALSPHPSIASSKEAPQYGQNEQVAAKYAVNGTTLYVETYGQGQPILMIHGNAGSIDDMKHQIAYFSERYKVIVVDSRGHGKSERGDGPLTYVKMAGDYSQLLAKLDLGPVDVLGWSDGGIIGLLLAIDHPEQVAKLAVMGANLNPGGARDWALSLVGSWRKGIEAAIAAGNTSENLSNQFELLNLLGDQPNIDVKSLQKIRAPTLVMAGDMDVIRNEHTLEMFENIPNAHLCIFPGSTHMVPQRKPELFNATVETFFSEPFSRPTTREIFEGP